LVVATVKSLQGSDIETYANQLFRTWKLGQAQKNNGVLLLVAPAEHKVRIEVGYGLEGTLTDALSSVIISSAIVPRFKANDYSGGVERGVDGIISVLNGDTTDWQPKVEVREDGPAQVFNALFPIMFFLFFILVFRLMVGRCAARRRAIMSDATDSWSLCLIPARVGVRARVGAVATVAARRAAAAHREAGDAPYA
ncbi:MAG TPA: TPM domain-containing protein, partial [Xanthobacteraceae bacterium]|nr:TPM domain-containing protein [Xanthobacteraceae bacterium]